MEQRSDNASEVALELSEELGQILETCLCSYLHGGATETAQDQKDDLEEERDRLVAESLRLLQSTQ